ncbi:MAG: bifunctional riboflavin kinase/FAD synthetase [Lachnospiraceae bacterium]|nr:bifunctional riboflavin kinase/FAD synthetase [Lachnospiraceae bacterium]
MEYIANTTEFQLENTAVALGKFEGLHKGHQLLLNELDKFQKQGLKSVMFTFDLPPNAVIKHDYRKVIYTKEERRRILSGTPLDYLIEHPFTEQFSRLRPEEFVEKVLIKKAGAKQIVVGEDFHFGYRRAGNVKVLQELAPKFGYELTVIPKLQIDGEDVSSSRIRNCLQKGDMAKANELLGYPFTVWGEVVHGKRLGSTVLGMPTANQTPPANKYLPPNGVYVSRIMYQDQIYYGISNIGVKPTIDEHIEKGVETYIFDFDQDIYGEMITVQLLDFERPEKKFASFEELSSQMKRDAEYGKEFARHYQ